MILVDANLLVYAHVESASFHDPARRWLDDRLNGNARVGLPWPSLLAFVRLVTNPRIYSKPSTLDQAWRVVEAWLEAPPVWIPQPTERHPEFLERMLLSGASATNLVPDAHLAALAVEHGLVLQSADRGFARFPDLRFENPLA